MMTEMFANLGRRPPTTHTRSPRFRFQILPYETTTRVKRLLQKFRWIFPTNWLQVWLSIKVWTTSEKFHCLPPYPRRQSRDPTGILLPEVTFKGLAGSYVSSLPFSLSKAYGRIAYKHVFESLCDFGFGSPALPCCETNLVLACF